MKARLKFSKIGSMRFIGHLDVMRYFQKAMKRANIEISYSQGFSPHQLMSFASPLGIGLSSDGEYLDIVLEHAMEKEDFLSRINAQMNEEITVTDFTLLEEESKSSMAVLAACDYLVALKPDKTSFLSDPERRKEVLSHLNSREKIEILKKTKRSEKMTDIKDNIYFLTEDRKAFENFTGLNYGQISLDETVLPLFYVQLTAGSVVNIKPELVLEALCGQEGEIFDPLCFQIHRLEMYGDLNMKKGEVHTLTTEPRCELVSLSKYGSKWIN